MGELRLTRLLRSEMTFFNRTTTNMKCVYAQNVQRLESGHLLLRVKARLTAATEDFWEWTKIFLVSSDDNNSETEK